MFANDTVLGGIQNPRIDETSSRTFSETLVVDAQQLKFSLNRIIIAPPVIDVRPDHRDCRYSQRVLLRIEVLCVSPCHDIHGVRRFILLHWILTNGSIQIVWIKIHLH